MKNLSKETKKAIIVSLFIFIILLILAIFFHVKSVEKVRNECNKVNREMSDRINGATRVVYRAITDIAQGQAVTAELVQMEPEALSDTVQELMITEEDLGKQATVNISAGEEIHKSMVGEALEKNWQETELNCVWLSTNLKQYDYVDIRVLFPNGTDYIVASKKSVQSLKLSKNNVFFWFTEDEILNVDAAIVDANLHGARIYTTKYVDPALEPANIVNYQPSDAVIDLLNSSPNVLAEAKENLSKSARAEMEEKLRSFKESVSDQKREDLENEYSFHLGTDTNASTGDVSENNHGTGEEEVPDNTGEQEDSNTDSARNRVDQSESE